GFETWPKLVRHVAALEPSAPLTQFTELANDLVAACAAGDANALGRVNRLFGKSFSPDELRAEAVRRLAQVVGRPTEFSLADVPLVDARRRASEGGARLAGGGPGRPSAPRVAPHGLSASPPFYRIDRRANTIVPRPPVSDRDWEAICAVMQEHDITGLNASGQ